jgi:putative oxidoreductase
MDIAQLSTPLASSATLLVFRLALGLLMAGHGAQKLFGWFGGYGLAGTGGFLEGLGFRPGRLFAAAAGLGELVSGLLVAVGLLGPIGPALMISVMIVAIVSVHLQHGVFAAANGVELPLLYAVGALALGFTGPGAFSLDAVLRIADPWPAALTWGIVGAGLAGGVASLSARRPPAPAPSA